MLDLSSYSHFGWFYKDENFLGLLIFFLLLMGVPLFLWITAYLKLFFILLWQKTILKVELFDDKSKQKAMKNVACLPGIESEVLAKFTLIPVWFMWKLSKIKSLFSSKRLKKSHNDFVGFLFFFLLFPINQMVYLTHRRKPSS